MKKIISLVLCAALIASAMAGCGSKEETPSTTPPAASPEIDGSAETLSMPGGEVKTGSYSDRDRSGEYFADVREVTLGGEPLVITEAATYVLSGSSSAGVTVECDGEVQIVLNGASVTAEGNAIDANSSAKLYITLADGTDNTLSGVLSRGDVTFNGGGALTLGSVAVIGTLTVAGGLITVESEANALTGAVVQMCGGTLDVTAGATAVMAARMYTWGDDELEMPGVSAPGEVENDVYIDGGAITVNSAATAISAEGGVFVNDGSVNVLGSTQGLSGASITVSGGEVNIASEFDALSSNAVLSYEFGGEYDGAMEMQPFGITDDAENAPDGSAVIQPFSGTADGSTGDNPNVATDGTFSIPNGTAFEVDANCYIHIAGGVVTVNSVNGGVYSGGSFGMTGGELYVGGSFSYMGDGIVTGGVLVAAGQSNSTGGLSDTSTQYSFLVSLSAAARENSTLTVRDGSNNTIVAHEFTGSFQSVLVSAPQLKQGGVYTVSADGKTATVTLNSVAEGSTGGGFGRFGGRGGPMINFGEMGPGQVITLPDGTQARQFTGEDGSTLIISGDIAGRSGGNPGDSTEGFFFSGDGEGAISVAPIQPGQALPAGPGGSVGYSVTGGPSNSSGTSSAGGPSNSSGPTGGSGGGR